jgi:uncharacterized protein (DUF1501 family)
MLNLRKEAMQYDFRSVYGTVLRDWLGMNEQMLFQF